MNANELADDLNGGDVSYITMDKAATMLRQQQAKIEQLLTIAEDYQLFIVNQKSEIEALKHWQDTWRPFLKQHFGIEK